MYRSNFLNDNDSIDLDFFETGGGDQINNYGKQNDYSKIVTKAVIETNPLQFDFQSVYNKQAAKLTDYSTGKIQKNLNSYKRTDCTSTSTSSVDKLLDVENIDESIFNCVAYSYDSNEKTQICYSMEDRESSNSSLSDSTITTVTSDFTSISPLSDCILSDSSESENYLDNSPTPQLHEDNCTENIDDEVELLSDEDQTHRTINGEDDEMSNDYSLSNAHCSDGEDKTNINGEVNESVEDEVRHAQLEDEELVLNNNSMLLVGNENCSDQANTNDANLVQDTIEDDSDTNDLDEQIYSNSINGTSEKGKASSREENNFSAEECHSERKDSCNTEYSDIFEHESDKASECSYLSDFRQESPEQSDSKSVTQRDSNMTSLEEELGEISLASQNTSKSSLQKPLWRNSNKVRMRRRECNLSFTREELIRIERDNIILLKKIMAHAKPKAVTLNQPFTHKKTSAAINRAKQQKKINHDNFVLFNKICAIGGMKKVF